MQGTGRIYLGLTWHATLSQQTNGKRNAQNLPLFSFNSCPVLYDSPPSDLVNNQGLTPALPSVSKGFWNALDDVSPDAAYVIAPVKESYPMKGGVTVTPLQEILTMLQEE